MLQDFDIDIVMIGYKIKERTWVTKQGASLAICRRQATMLPITLNSPVPTNANIKILTMSLKRMQQYPKRGFSFHDHPQICPITNVCTTHNQQTQHDLLQESHIVNVLARSET
jgi:hypothetical protein